MGWLLAHIKIHTRVFLLWKISINVNIYNLFFSLRTTMEVVLVSILGAWTKAVNSFSLEEKRFFHNSWVLQEYWKPSTVKDAATTALFSFLLLLNLKKNDNLCNDSLVT